MDLRLDVAAFTSFEVVKINLGMNVIFISLTYLLSQTSGFQKEKWTVAIIGAIFFGLALARCWVFTIPFRPHCCSIS